MEYLDWILLVVCGRCTSGVGRAKTVLMRWGYLDDAHSVDYDCGEPHTMAHLLSCRLLDEACTADDIGHSDRAGKGMRPQVGEKFVKDATEEEEFRGTTID